MSDKQADERQALAAILTENYDWLTGVGWTRDGLETVAIFEGRTKRWNQEIHVVTRAPSGQHYQWTWEDPLTENQEAFGPAEYGTPKLTPVHPVEETIVVTKWVADE